MIRFGTGGWRAIIGDGFTKENVRILSQAICEDMKDDTKGIVIGYDRRFLSDSAARWAAEVFAGNNIKVHFIDRVSPTPMVMFAVKELGTKYGMSITASHNPAAYNGIKVFTEGGRDADKSVTDKLERIMEKGVEVKALDFDKALASGVIVVNHSIYNIYIDSIISMINMDAIRSKNLRVLLDPMFGVSKTSLQTILMTARCDVDIINDRHDTLFGGRLPSPSAGTLTRLSELVVEKGYDIGIGTDGDADRIGIIDDKGRFIHPNEILVLLYYYLIKYKGWKGDAVRNIATTHILDKIAEDNGFKCHEVKVGFKHISSKMEETDALIGGESSGGLTIKGHIKGKDGIFAASLLVEMICVTDKKLSEMLDEIYEKYGRTFMKEYDTKFTEEKKQYLIDLLFEQKKLPDFEGRLGHKIEKISYLDGVKVYFENGGWVIVRFSGTEPLIRVFCEMENEKDAGGVIDLVKEFIE
ncbi:MAG: phosphoglucomutase/phosphomannomutase family protein [Clostridiaceae bacterium]|nr:phosphoglucomutase/phosphomannomutase family protein [Clostridiaceae bacterium]